MKFDFQTLVNGTRWDAIGIGDGLVATVELKRSNGRAMSDWWFSGLNQEDELVVLTRISMGHGLLEEREAIVQLESVFAEILREPVLKLAALGGLSDAPNTGSTENKLALSLAHLDGHQKLGNIGSSQSIRVDAARQYQLIKSFGYSNAQKLISERLGLPKTTIERRLFLARESGHLHKMSDASNINI